MTSGTGAAIQRRPDELVDILAADFQARSEPQFAWKSLVSSYLAIPGVRALWPMSSINYQAAGQARDVAGGLLPLASNGACTFGYTNLFPWVDFDSASTQYLSYADGGAGTHFDFSGAETYVSASLRGMAMGCWVYFDAAAAADEMIMGKYGAAGQRSYRLQRDAAGTVSFTVSTDGTAVVTETSTATIGSQTWTFVAVRFDPSGAGNELKVWVNEVTSTAAATIATLHDSTADFNIGANGTTSADYMDGRVSMAWTSCMLVSDSIINQLFEQARVCYGVLL